MTFSMLSRSSALGSLPGEGHLLWNLFHEEDPAGRRPEATPPDATRPEAIAPGERRALYWMIRHLARGRRFLDKTPRNSLQIPYLVELFPDASFVFLARDGRATVSSLMDGWRESDGMFPGRRMAMPIRIEGYAGDRWKFVAPPGWQAYASGHTLEEVCAFQWVACMEAILAAKDVIAPERWMDTTYEHLTASPVEEASRLLTLLGLPQDDEVLEHAANLELRVTRATSAPRAEKWRAQNAVAIERILPMIAPTMGRLGYQI
jgi:hypothetical protein